MIVWYNEISFSKQTVKKKEEITKSYIAGRLYCRFYKQTSLNNSKWASHLSWGTPSTPTPQLLPVWGFFLFFFFFGGVGGSGLASHGLLQQADTWPLARQRIKPTWKTPKRRWRAWEGGIVEQTSGFTDTEECCQSAQECGGLVFPWGPKTLFLPPNPSISTSTTKMKHTASRCLSHHLESCTPLHQLCVVANQYEVLDIPSYNKSCLI